MLVERVGYNLPKGIALIVGKKRDEDKFEVDLTVLHTAYCVSDTPHYIDSKNVNLSDNKFNRYNTIYICGHGRRFWRTWYFRRKEGTIGRRSMKEIAGLLVNGCNYTGKQSIYITSCESRGELVDRLKSELESLGIPNCNVVSTTYGGSITVSEGGIINQYNVSNPSSIIVNIKSARYTSKLKPKYHTYSSTDAVVKIDYRYVNNKKLELINKLRWR